MEVQPRNRPNDRPSDRLIDASRLRILGVKAYWKRFAITFDLENIYYRSLVDASIYFHINLNTQRYSQALAVHDTIIGFLKTHVSDDAIEQAYFDFQLNPPDGMKPGIYDLINEIAQKRSGNFGRLKIHIRQETAEYFRKQLEKLPALITFRFVLVLETMALSYPSPCTTLLDDIDKMPSWKKNLELYLATVHQSNQAEAYLERRFALCLMGQRRYGIQWIRRPDQTLGDGSP